MDRKFVRTKVNPWYRGVTRNHAGVQKKFNVMSFDVETFHGMPYHVGFYNGKNFYDSRGLQEDHFMWLIKKIIECKGKSDKTVCVFAHNIQFDLAVLLFPFLFNGCQGIKRAPKQSYFSFREKVSNKFVTCQIFWGKPCFGKIRIGKKTIHLLDSYAFIGMSLEKALEMIKAPVQKLPKPDNLGKRLIPYHELRPYLINDTLGVWYLAEEILKWHQEYDVKLCVSTPQLSGRIFRHCFLKDNFVKPNLPLRYYSMLSYHGGKNTFNSDVGWKNGVYELDINSAYPEAMLHIPAFYKGNWKVVRKFSGSVGIYQVTGLLQDCKWGCLFTHDYRKMNGYFRNTWVTGWELEEAMRSKEIKVKRVRGLVWDGNPDNSPFVEFVKHFYEKRMKSKSDQEKYFYKIVMNSLYGKFVQRSWGEVVDEIRTAGSMFHPFIATLITGYVNAKIHRLEHKYNSIHTATDSIKTVKEPDPDDLGTELGKMKVEVHGPCLLLRNKLYVHKDEKTGKVKVGLHGFQGDHNMLIEMFNKNKWTYTRRRLVRWAEAWHKGIQPGQEISFPMDLMVD